MEIEWAKWSKIINKSFLPLTKNTDRFLILYGSRGSSKTDYASKQLIFNCLTHSYFKCILYRKNYNTIHESSYETVKQNILSLGLESLFEFRTSPLQIICKNGNRFIARGGDDSQALKSIKDPTTVWYEEDVPNESDFATISLTLRSSKAEYIQEIFTINPQIEGNPTDNWFYKRFFENESELSFRRKTKVEVENRSIEYYYTVHHSTYKDNKWLKDEVKAQIEDYKRTDPYLYSVYGLGLWTQKETGGNVWKHFNAGIHVGSYSYNPNQPLHLSFDENVNPYLPVLIFQISNKNIYCIGEIAAKNPKNTISQVTQLIISMFPNHNAGMFIYGDATSKKQDVKIEKGANFFTLFRDGLQKYKPTLRVNASNPNVVMSINFINQVFGFNFNDIKINIDKNCVTFINDLSYAKEAPDGGIFKQVVKDSETGVSYQKYGHFSDCLRYLVCIAFSNDYSLFQNGNNKVQILKARNNSSKVY
jgi:PBSX family phage terminase large subunit